MCVHCNTLFCCVYFKLLFPHLSIKFAGAKLRSCSPPNNPYSSLSFQYWCFGRFRHLFNILWIERISDFIQLMHTSFAKPMPSNEDEWNSILLLEGRRGGCTHIKEKCVSTQVANHISQDTSVTADRAGWGAMCRYNRSVTRRWRSRWGGGCEALRVAGSLSLVLNGTTSPPLKAPDSLQQPLKNKLPTPV